MNFDIETEREIDGRWIAEVVEIPGVLKYGATREQAIARAEELARRVVADRKQHEQIPIHQNQNGLNLDSRLRMAQNRLLGSND